MARFAIIEDGIVSNIIEASENFGLEIGAVYVSNRHVNIGDSYADGKFYRDGEEVPKFKTNLELQIEAQSDAIAELSLMLSMMMGGEM